MKIFERLPDGFSRVNRVWVDAAVVIIGGGPSITPQQIEIVATAQDEKRCKVIAINDASFLLAPWADVMYAADPRWWEWHKNDKVLNEFGGERSSIQIENYKHPSDVHIIRNADYPNHSDGLSTNPCAIRTGSNGGWQALNIAILAGTRNIYLLGYDGGTNKEGKSHFHKGHKVPTPAQAYAHYKRSFTAAENDIRDAGVLVVNCNLASHIDTFPKSDIGKFL